MQIGFKKSWFMKLLNYLFSILAKTGQMEALLFLWPVHWVQRPTAEGEYFYTKTDKEQVRR